MTISIAKPEEIWMQRCIELARKGIGSVSPNPLVGAVVIRDGRIIGEGYHRKFGEPHAEVNALQSAKEDVRGATVAVNLEPCNYFGKTPPCTDLLIRSGVSRVVVGMLDPNPKVSGRGVEQLRQAGIAVVAGILEDECRRLNRVFLKYIRTGMPYVTLKAAQTIDGKIARQSGRSTWITGKESRIHAHRLRAESDAILIGANTVIADDPQLTVREVKGKNPARIILSTRIAFSSSAAVFSHSRSDRVIVFTGESIPEDRLFLIDQLNERGVEVHQLPLSRSGILPLKDVLSILGGHGIASLLIEGGAATYATFLQQGLVDAMALYVAPKIFGGGLDAFYNVTDHHHGEYIKLRESVTTRLGEDILIEGEL